MLVDTHAHLNNERYNVSIKEIVENAYNNDVEKIVSVGCHFNEIERSLEISSKFQNVYTTVGLYPHDTVNDKYLEFDIDSKITLLENYAKNPKVVAIGECGLDFSTPNSKYEIENDKNTQLELFEKQILLAKKLDKPLVIHSREALNETLDILSKHYNRDKLNGVWHCFCYGTEILEKIIDLGFMISVGGLITFSSMKDLKYAVKNMDLSFLLLETDSPFLVPAQVRNLGVSVNEPQFTKTIAEYIAKKRNIDFKELAYITTDNANRLFRL